MGKKGKKSRKQIEEELLKAQEEQLKAEEEEAARQAELARIQAEEDARKAAEDEQKAQEETERLESEQPFANEFRGDLKNDLDYEIKKISDALEWAAFLKCYSKPDVRYEADITAYMASLKELEVDDMKQALNTATDCEEIVRDLREIWCECKGSGRLEKQNWASRFVNDIRILEAEKFDQSMTFFVGHIEPSQINARSEVQSTWSSATAPASTAGQPVIPSGQHPGATAPLRVGFWGTMAAASKFRAKVVDQYTIGVLLELPKSIGLQAAGHQIGVRALYTEYDPISYQADYLREESGEGGGDGGAGGESAGHYINRLSVGGVCKVDLLSIPLRPKFFEKNQWSMRTLPAEGAGLTILPYPNPAGGMQQNLQPCKVEYRVPDHVVVDSNLEVSYWDSSEQNWARDNIEEVSFDPITRKVAFYSLRLSYFSITQPKTLELPYHYWIVRPKAPHADGNQEVEVQVKTTR